MSDRVHHKDRRRARVFELMQQVHRAESTTQRIRRLARRNISSEDFEQFKSNATRSLQVEH